MELELRVALALGGTPVTKNVTVPAGGFEERFALKVNVAKLPALMLMVLDEVGVIATGWEIVALSEALLLLRLASLIPKTFAVFTIKPAAVKLTFAVTLMGG